MNAFDFNKIANNSNAKSIEKRAIKTKRRTPQFLKFILKLIKKQAKQGYYSLNIPNHIDFVEYGIVFKKLEDLNFRIVQDYGCYTIKWEKGE